MVGISASVGENKPNRFGDVRAVQSLLNRNVMLIGGGRPLEEDGLFGPKTEAAIVGYQGRVLRFSQPDGVVDPGGPTIRSLGRHASTATLPAPPTPQAAAPGGRSSSGASGSGSYIDAARTLGCEAAAIEAVAVTESLRAAFDGQGRPTILYERHVFHRETSGRFDQVDENLSNKNPGGYNAAPQYDRLERAKRLDETAALKSCSWGKFQIMGFNHRAAGYATVHTLVAAMQASEANHLSAFVNFVNADARLKRAIQQRDWPTFARIYNGPDYRKNNYDTKMRDNYNRLTATS